MFEQLKYLFQFRSSPLYRLGYIYSSCVKLFKLAFFGQFDFTHFPFSGDFIITNSLGTFKICEPSDMHSVLNPNSEKDLLPYFRMEGGIFLDIGTNVGKYSVYVGKYRTDNTIYAFEPNTYLYENYLSENIRLNNLTNVHLVNLGLSSQPWSCTLTVPANNFGGGSLANTYADGREYTVQLVTLDDFVHENAIDVSNIRLIKIDVEWHEYQTILGARETLSQLHNCRLIIEVFEASDHSTETLRSIEAAGFILERKLYGDNYIFSKPWK